MEGTLRAWEEGQRGSGRKSERGGEEDKRVKLLVHTHFQPKHAHELSLSLSLFLSLSLYLSLAPSLPRSHSLARALSLSRSLLIYFSLSLSLTCVGTLSDSLSICPPRLPFPSLPTVRPSHALYT